MRIYITKFGSNVNAQNKHRDRDNYCGSMNTHGVNSWGHPAPQFG